MRIILAIMMIIMIKIVMKIKVMIIIIMIRQRKIILCIAIVMMRMMVINIMAVPNGFASYHFPALSSLYFPHNFQCINFAAPVMASFVFLLYQCLKFPWQMLYSFTSLIPRFILTLYPRRLLFYDVYCVFHPLNTFVSKLHGPSPIAKIFIPSVT